MVIKACNEIKTCMMNRDKIIIFHILVLMEVFQTEYPLIEFTYVSIVRSSF